MNRQSWRIHEDEAICKLVAQYGFNDWTKIAQKLKQTYSITKRTGKQCRQRWYNHLNPSVNKKPWDNQQQTLLFKLHKSHGNRWKELSCFFIGRTDNDIKNHFYSTLRRSLRRLNKISGQKNSTSQMRQIKPSVLSTIMSYIYNQQHEMQKDLLLSLKDLPTLIFQYANFKPIKNNIKNHPIEDSRIKIFQIFQLINKFNDQYQKNKQVKYQQKTIKRHNHQRQSPDITTIQSSLNNNYHFQDHLLNKRKKDNEKDIQQSDEYEEDNDSNIVKLQEDNSYYVCLVKEQNQEKNNNQQDKQCENVDKLSKLKRNLSLQEQDNQQAQMPQLIQPDRYNFQGEQQALESQQIIDNLDLTIVGHRWQPQNWQTQLQIKQFIDEVLQMNYDIS